MKRYAFWNNKGGTGKTSLCFQAVCFYAAANPDDRILVIDVCPQANLSELFLGGLLNKGSHNLLARQGETARATIGGYFQLRLPSPYSVPAFAPQDYITKPWGYNSFIPENIDLVCGDPLLELQSNAISTLSNTRLPGTDTWAAIVGWLLDFLEPIKDEYDTMFIDANPAFSMYTQIAIATAKELILPVMADDSSRRAIQNAFSLIYGLKLPSEVYAEYAFATKLKNANRDLPLVRAIAKNRLTQYMGPASAYAGVLKSIETDVATLFNTHSAYFSPGGPRYVDIRDFQTTGVVAFAKGCPFFSLQSGRINILGQRVRVNEQYRQDCVEAIEGLAKIL